MTPSVQRSLAGIPLLQGLDELEMRRLEQTVSWRELHRNEVVLHKGMPGDHLLFLIEGRLRVVDVTADGREVGLNLLQPGDHFGELAIIDGGVRSASVVAMEWSRIALLPRAQAWQLFYGHPLVAQRVLVDLAGRLRKASIYQSLLCMPQAHQRVFALIDLLSRSQTGGGACVEHLPRQQELAAMANTSRETVSRALTQLRQQGLSRLEGHRLLIRSRDALQALVHMDTSTTR